MRRRALALGHLAVILGASNTLAQTVPVEVPSYMLGTLVARYYPERSAGKLEGCMFTFLHLTTQKIEGTDTTIYVEGSTGVVFPEGKFGGVLKLNVKRLVGKEKSIVEQASPPSLAYFVLEDSSTTQELRPRSTMGDDGSLITAFSQDQGMKLALQIVKSAHADLVFDQNQNSEIVATIDFTVAGHDAAKKRIHTERDIKKFSDCLKQMPIAPLPPR